MEEPRKAIVEPPLHDRSKTRSVLALPLFSYGESSCPTMRCNAFGVVHCAKLPEIDASTVALLCSRLR